jgi:hypothetical protein
MYGEDCRYKLGFHNLKDSEGLRRRLHLPSAVKLIFMDDNPQRIIPDRNTRVVPIPTYSYRDAETEKDALIEAILRIH